MSAESSRLTLQPQGMLGHPAWFYWTIWVEVDPDHRRRRETTSHVRRGVSLHRLGCAQESETLLVGHASGCVVECQICNGEVAGSNLSLGYFAPRSTQPSIPPGSVNEYQLRVGRQRQAWLIPLADETHGVQVKLCYPLTMCTIPQRLRDASCGGTIQTDYLYLFYIS